MKEKFNVMNLFEEKKLVKICAPMVRYSKLQFRNLVKLYDCDLVYTPMILADSFCKSEKARRNEFTTNSLDTPLIAQFATNTVQDFVEAAYMISPYCDGIDLNCGCPQRWAKEQGIGSEMLKNPQLICDIIKQCRNFAPKTFTVSVKIRLLNKVKDTVELVRQLEKCGVDFVAVHARTPEQSVGEINRDELKLIKESCDIPIIGNGGLTSLHKCQELQDETGCDGVMVANAILSNPAIFSGYEHTPIDCVQNWIDICYNSTVTEETIETELLKSSHIIPKRPFNLTFQCFHHHLVFMMEKLLTRKQRMYFNNLKTFEEVLNFMETTFDLRPRLFEPSKFSEHILCHANYVDCDSVFRQTVLPSLDGIDDNFIAHDICEDGKYFQNKLESNEDFDCDWSGIFLEKG